MKCLSLFLVGLIAISFSTASSLAQQTLEPQIVDVFVPGADGYPAIRIPSLVTTQNGILLAFAEGRQAGDHSLNEIILKRSLDGGESWSGLSVINRVEGMALNNPQAVVLGNGRVLLMYQQNRLGERAAQPGFGPDSYSSWIQFSDDNGESWSDPRDITVTTKREQLVTSVASGPGIGIVLCRTEKYKGRILMPMNQGPFGNWAVYAAISDDGGQSWSMGSTAPEGKAAGFANEVQMVELADGAVMLNARIQGSKLRFRRAALSRDGGETWSETQAVPELIDPVCQAAMLRYCWPDTENGKPGIILFLNPASAEKRESGGLRASADDGVSWSDPKVVYPGGFAYSCLTRMSDGRIGILFEKDGYRSISFMAIDPKTVIPGQNAEIGEDKS